MSWAKLQGLAFLRKVLTCSLVACIFKKSRRVTLEESYRKLKYGSLAIPTTIDIVSIMPHPVLSIQATAVWLAGVNLALALSTPPSYPKPFNWEIAKFPSEEKHSLSLLRLPPLSY